MMLKFFLFSFPLFAQITTKQIIMTPQTSVTPGNIIFKSQDTGGGGFNFAKLQGPNVYTTSYTLTLPDTASAGPTGTYWNLCADDNMILTWCSTTGAGSFIDTTTNQSGLTGDKVTSGVWTFNAIQHTQTMLPTTDNAWGIGNSGLYYYSGYINNIFSKNGIIGVYDAAGVTLQSTMTSTGISTSGSIGNLNASISAAGNALFVTTQATSGSTTAGFSVGTLLTANTGNITSLIALQVAPPVANTGAVGFTSQPYGEINGRFVRSIYTGSSQTSYEMLNNGEFKGYYSGGNLLFQVSPSSGFLRLFDTLGRDIIIQPTSITLPAAFNTVAIGSDAGIYRTCGPAETIRGPRYVAGWLVAGTCAP